MNELSLGEITETLPSGPLIKKKALFNTTFADVDEEMRPGGRRESKNSHNLARNGLHGAFALSYNYVGAIRNRDYRTAVYSP